MTPTQQQIEEIALKYSDLASSTGAHNPLISPAERHEITKNVIKQALTEATQLLLERVKELETELAEAQQWIDSEPDWKDKYMANYQQLQSQLTTLEAACTEQRLALEQQVGRTEYGNRFGADFYATNKHFGFCSKGAGNPRECSVCGTYYKMKDALLSTSGQRILEENRRMREALEKLAKKITLKGGESMFVFGAYSDEVSKIASEALSTNQPNQGE